MKSFLIAVFLLCSASLLYAAFSRTSVATDDFNRADGPPGANWSSRNTWTCSNLKVISNTIGGSHSPLTPPCSAAWVGAGTFTDDQYVEATITANMSSGVTDVIGVSCRNSADVDASGHNASDRYEYHVVRNTSGSAQTTRIVKVVNGVRTTLISSAVLWIATDEISIECTGQATTTIEGFKNGILQHSVADSSSPLLTGQPGAVSGVATTGVMDNWVAGSLAPAVFTTGRRRVSSQ